MYIDAGNGHGDLSSNPGCNCLHSTNTIGKGMKPTILLLAMGKIIGQAELFNLGITISLGGKLNLKLLNSS